MKILIEGHQYVKDGNIEKICGDFENAENGKIKVSKVGYFYNPAIQDCVLCLPKVVKDHDKSTYLGGLQAEKLTDAFSEDCSLDPVQQEFVKSFSLWSYRTISTYAKLNPQSNIIDMRSSATVSDDASKLGSFLDTIFDLIEFYNRNKEYFIFTIKNLHKGYEKVNWRKTVARKTAFIQNGSPIYLEVINQKKQIDFDEELMIIFYSIIHYISNYLQLIVPVECHYELITGGKFEAYLEGVGLRRLEAIRYKYFSDKDLKLWNLCYAFFQKSAGVKESEKVTDYLFVGSFHKVFESMIDALIGDEKYQHMKVMDDGKIIDHIFKYKSPIDGKEVFYIGDSKYYAIGSKLDDKSINKQFTYAKNIIQYHIKREDGVEGIRDNITEGYNFIPNFFISANIPSLEDYNSDRLESRELNEEEYSSFHFENRLFDRDTLYLAHFDINLLFIMMLYAQDNRAEQVSFSNRFKEKIFKSVNSILDSKYHFYLPKHLNEKFIEKEFKRLNGKVYPVNKGQFLLALEQGNDLTAQDEEWLELTPNDRKKLSDILNS